MNFLLVAIGGAVGAMLSLVLCVAAVAVGERIVQ